MVKDRFARQCARCQSRKRTSARTGLSIFMATWCAYLIAQKNICRYMPRISQPGPPSWSRQTSRLLKKPSMAFSRTIRTPLARIPAVDSGILPSALRANADGVVQNRSRRFCRGIETSCLATWFSNGSHFQWLAAIKNVGRPVPSSRQQKNCVFQQPARSHRPSAGWGSKHRSTDQPHPSGSGR